MKKQSQISMEESRWEMWKCRKVQVGCPTGGSSLEKTHCTGTGFLRTERGLARKERQLGDTELPPKGEGDWAGENSAGGSDCPATFAVSLRTDPCL